MTPKVLILRTAGTNCDRETAHAFRRAEAEVDLIHVNRAIEAPRMLEDYRIIVFPGGFTYGDDLGAGTIFANRIRTVLLDPVRDLVSRGGLVLGICNGFQILVKTGLLPAIDGYGETGAATLAANDSNRFEDRWVHLEVASDLSPFVSKGDRIRCPVAHAEGKFVTRDEPTLTRLMESGQVVFRYVAGDGSPNPPYPLNPNGSRHAVAGICDPTGRILGLMPHPERHLEPGHHPSWTREGLAEEGDGVRLFRNAVAAVAC
ncbi:MAG: phosphoribosylformylglycinamidine synthase I [Planctomycetota bacterium]